MTALPISTLTTQRAAELAASTDDPALAVELRARDREQLAASFHRIASDVVADGHRCICTGDSDDLATLDVLVEQLQRFIDRARELQDMEDRSI